MVFCHYINNLFKGLKEEHSQSDWRLFIDSSQRSLRAVLLRIANSKHSIPIAHSIHLNEIYDIMKILLETIQYSVHQWNICGDLKVTGMLICVQEGFTKLCCFLCLWHSRSAAEHTTARLCALLKRTLGNGLGKLYATGFEGLLFE
jgi:hypothetical protein